MSEDKQQTASELFEEFQKQNIEISLSNGWIHLPPDTPVELLQKAIDYTAELKAIIKGRRETWKSKK